MARLIGVLQLPNRGHLGLEKSRPRAASSKIVTPHPRVLSGGPYEKVNLHCFVRAWAIQPATIIRPYMPERRFLSSKMMAIADNFWVLRNPALRSAHWRKAAASQESICPKRVVPARKSLSKGAKY